eukprot:563057-Rhodomonas_salina.2
MDTVLLQLRPAQQRLYTILARQMSAPEILSGQRAAGEGGAHEVGGWPEQRDARLERGHRCEVGSPLGARTEPDLVHEAQVELDAVRQLWRGLVGLGRSSGARERRLGAGERGGEGRGAPAEARALWNAHQRLAYRSHAC